MVKLCNYLLETECTVRPDSDEVWVSCRRLGDVRVKTCDKCAFNVKNRKLRAKARMYYRIMK
ncbi:MAG: hypothetical protein ABH829_00860 [archaeon]